MSKKMVKKESGTPERVPERVSERPAAVPRVDLFENDEELLLVADLPGVKKDGLDVQFHDGTLSIEGRRNPTHEQAALLRREYQTTDFVRHFLVPEGIDVGKIAAELRNGTLTLHLPKAEAAKPRKIAVRAE